MLKIVVCCGGSLPVLFNLDQKLAANAAEQQSSSLKRLTLNVY